MIPARCVTHEQAPHILRKPLFYTPPITLESHINLLSKDCQYRLCLYRAVRHRIECKGIRSLTHYTRVVKHQSGRKPTASLIEGIGRLVSSMTNHPTTLILASSLLFFVLCFLSVITRVVYFPCRVVSCRVVSYSMHDMFFQYVFLPTCYSRYVISS